MNSESLFNVRLKRAIEYIESNKIEVMSFDEVIDEKKNYLNKYNKLFLDVVWNDSEIIDYTEQIDFLLMVYHDLVEKITNELFDESLLIHNDKKHTIYLQYQIKLLYQDILVVRNLWSMQFEAQCNLLIRSIIEKSRLIILSIMDKEYAKKLFYNVDEKDSWERYNKIYKPSVVKKKLNNIIKSDNNHRAFIYLIGETINAEYDIDSLFVHSDIFQIMLYSLNKENGINISLYKNSTMHFAGTIVRIQGLLLPLYLDMLAEMKNPKFVKKLKYYELLNGYYRIYFDEIYGEIYPSIKLKIKK